MRFLLRMIALINSNTVLLKFNSSITYVVLEVSCVLKNNMEDMFKNIIVIVILNS